MLIVHTIYLKIILLSSCPTVHHVSSTNQTSAQLPNISATEWTDLGCSGRATWPWQSCRPVCCAV